MTTPSAPWHPRELLPYSVAASLSGAAAWACARWWLAGGPGSASTILAIASSLAAVWLVARRRPGDVRASAAVAGLGLGFVVGLLVAMRAPSYWFSPDIAWHTAKVALAAAGHPLQDPILREVTIYPGLFHSLLAPAVSLGLDPATVMRGVTPVALAGSCTAFWWLARSGHGPRTAALLALALPWVFHAPSRGYASLADPSNLSWPVVFVGLGLLHVGFTREQRWHVLGAGVALGLAGLLWYAHLVWIAVATLLLVARHGRRALWLVCGGALPAAGLALHMGLVHRAGNLGFDAVFSAGNAAPLFERAHAVARNLLTLSGEASLSDAPWWVGAAVLALAVARWLRRVPGGRGRSPIHRVVVALVLTALWAGFGLRYWEPFSWRFLFLTYALLVWIAGEARPWTVGGLSVPIVTPIAVIAVPWAVSQLTPVVQSTAEMRNEFDAGAAAVSEFIEAHTGDDEMVFASIASWEHAIGCCRPRPNLVDRDDGRYKYAPRELAARRRADYESLIMATDGDECRRVLEPYGARYVLLHRNDLARPGFSAMARAFAPVLSSGDWIVVDIQKTRDGP